MDTVIEYQELNWLAIIRCGEVSGGLPQCSHNKEWKGTLGKRKRTLDQDQETPPLINTLVKKSRHQWLMEEVNPTNVQSYAPACLCYVLRITSVALKSCKQFRLLSANST